MTDEELVKAAVKKGDFTLPLRRRFKKARVALGSEPSEWDRTNVGMQLIRGEYERARQLLLRAIK